MLNVLVMKDPSGEGPAKICQMCFIIIPYAMFEIRDILSSKRCP